MCRQNPLRQVAPQSDGAEDVNGLVFGNFVQPVAKLFERDVHRPGDRSEGVLHRGAHVEQDAVSARCIRDFAPRHDGHRAADDVPGDVSRNGDRVLGRGERRGVAVFHLRQVADRPAALDEQRDLVDAFVHAVVTDRLRSVEAAGAGFEREFDSQRKRVGVVARVRRRVRGRSGVLDS